MFKVSLSNEAGEKFADSRFSTQEAAQAYCDKMTAEVVKLGPDDKKVTEPYIGKGAQYQIEDITAEMAAIKLANDEKSQKQTAAMDVLKNTDPATLKDPVLKAVVELLQR
jgi:hypothetical protein